MFQSARKLVLSSESVSLAHVVKPTAVSTKNDRLATVCSMENYIFKARGSSMLSSESVSRPHVVKRTTVSTENDRLATVYPRENHRLKAHGSSCCYPKMSV